MSTNEQRPHPDPDHQEQRLRKHDELRHRGQQCLWRDRGPHGARLGGGQRQHRGQFRRHHRPVGELFLLTANGCHSTPLQPTITMKRLLILLLAVLGTVTSANKFLGTP